MSTRPITPPITIPRRTASARAAQARRAQNAATVTSEASTKAISAKRMIPTIAAPDHSSTNAAASAAPRWTSE